MELILRRSPEQEAAFERLIADLHNPQSPNFHHWLTNAEIGKRYGLGEDDMGKIKGWMSSNGFKVKAVSPDHTFISFSGNAGQISKAFHTEIHLLSVNGVSPLREHEQPEDSGCSEVGGCGRHFAERLPSAHERHSAGSRTSLPQQTVDLRLLSRDADRNAQCLLHQSLLHGDAGRYGGDL